MTNITFEPVAEGRYDRHLLIDWWDQKRLARAKVIVAGAGALGNEVLKLLALMGFGHILVIDFDTVSRSNLARMVLFGEGDVGRPKVEVAVERIRELNPEIDVRGIRGDLRFDVGLGEYRDADLIFGCLDSVNARWALNRKGYHAGTVWIDGGISDYHGQVTKYKPGTGACYECNFTEATYERFNRRYSCPYGLLNRLTEDRVPTTAVTTSLIAALQVQEALYYLHDTPSDLGFGERLIMMMKPYRIIKSILPGNANCLAHDPLPAQSLSVNLSPDQLTAREVIRATQKWLPGDWGLELGFDLLTGFLCLDCHRRQSILRPKEKVYHDQGRCPDCGSMRMPESTNLIAADSELADLKLSRLSVPPREILTLKCGEQAVAVELRG